MGFSAVRHDACQLVKDRDGNVPKCDRKSVAMSATPALQLTRLRPASTALVPLGRPAQTASSETNVPSPDPTFVTQLIANHQQLRERRRWPRDRAADARLAYAHLRSAMGSKTRQKTI